MNGWNNVFDFGPCQIMLCILDATRTIFLPAFTIGKGQSVSSAYTTVTPTTVHYIVSVDSAGTLSISTDIANTADLPQTVIAYVMMPNSVPARALQQYKDMYVVLGIFSERLLFTQCSGTFAEIITDTNNNNFAFQDSSGQVQAGNVYGSTPHYTTFSPDPQPNHPQTLPLPESIIAIQLDGAFGNNTNALNCTILKTTLQVQADVPYQYFWQDTFNCDEYPS